VFPINLDFAFWENLHYNNIFILALELLLTGGWLFIFFNLWGEVKDAWINWRQDMFAGENPNVLMEIKVPEKSTRDIEAIEQLFAQIHGLHRNPTWWEKWWKGQYVLKVTFEVVSFGGQIKFYISSTHKHKNLVQHAVYAHYPDAEIRELKPEEDFIHIFPDKMPDKEFDMLGTEYVLYKPHYFPLKTYKEYEKNNVHLDPLRHMWELMSHLKEGEYVWYQLVLVPENEKWALAQRKNVNALMGLGGAGGDGSGDADGEGKSKSILGMIFEHLASMVIYIVSLPFWIIREFFRQIFVGTGTIIVSQVKDHTYGEFVRQIKGTGKEFPRQILCLHEAFLSQFRKKKKPHQTKEEQECVTQNNIQVEPAPVVVQCPELKFPSDYLFLSAKQKKAIDAAERKISKQIYKTCIRVLYFAKKPVYSKFRFWSELHGTFRHFNDIDYNVFTRGLYSKTTADYFFANWRKKMKKNTIIFNSKGRDWYAGDEWNYMSTEELASLWHFPHAHDLQANISTTKERATAPPRETPMRVRPGFNEDELVPVDPGAVPENLPVSDFVPSTYP